MLFVPKMQGIIGEMCHVNCVGGRCFSANVCGCVLTHCNFVSCALHATFCFLAVWIFRSVWTPFVPGHCHDGPRVRLFDQTSLTYDCVVNAIHLNTLLYHCNIFNVSTQQTFNRITFQVLCQYMHWQCCYPPVYHKVNWPLDRVFEYILPGIYTPTLEFIRLVNYYKCLTVVYKVLFTTLPIKMSGKEKIWRDLWLYLSTHLYVSIALCSVPSSSPVSDLQTEGAAGPVGASHQWEAWGDLVDTQ